MLRLALAAAACAVVGVVFLVASEFLRALARAFLSRCAEEGAWSDL